MAAGPAHAYPALVALDVALADLWRSWGVSPAVVAGVGVGAYAAAIEAGVLTLTDGLHLAATHGQLLQDLPAGGGMVSVFAPEALVSEVVSRHASGLSLASVNGPHEVIISGLRSELDGAIARLNDQGVACCSLASRHAHRSPLVETVALGVEQLAGKLHLAVPQVELLSAVDGSSLREKVTDPAHWRREVVDGQRLGESLATLRQRCTALIEIAPNPDLLNLARRSGAESVSRLWIPSLVRGRGEWQQLLKSLGALFVAGVEIDWSEFDGPYRRRRVALPNYPFQGKRYWFEGNGAAVSTSGSPVGAEELGRPMLDTRFDSPTQNIFETWLGTGRRSYLRDHRVFNRVVVPAAAHLELALEAAREQHGWLGVALQQVVLPEALILVADEERGVQVSLTPGPAGATSFSISSRAGGARAWIEHARGLARRSGAGGEPRVDLHGLQGRLGTELRVETLFEAFARLGLDYGPEFQRIDQLWCAGGEALARLRQVNSADVQFCLHPSLLDAAFQVALAAALPDPGGVALGDPFVPVSLDGLTYFGGAGTPHWCHVLLTTDSTVEPREAILGDLRLYDEAGKSLAHISGLQLKRAPRGAFTSAAEGATDSHYEVAWRPVASPPGGKTEGTWVVLADQTGMGAALKHELEQRGAECVLVTAGDTFTRRSGLDLTVDPTSAQQISRLFEELEAPAKGVVHLWSLDIPSVEEDKGASAAQQRLGWGSAVLLLQALARDQGSAPPRLCLVTRGAEAVDTEGVAVCQSPVRGLGRVIALEHPEVRCVRVDLDPRSFDETGAAAAQIADEIIDPGGEAELAYRSGERLARRLVRSHRDAHPDDGDSIELVVDAPGTLDGLKLVPTPRRPPRDGEVEVKIQATALNFRDVLVTMGLYPDGPKPLGVEGAGVVVGLGSGVEELQVGDGVIVFQGGNLESCFSRYVTTPATLVARRPPNLTLAAAAALPGVFLTAGYALEELAKLSAGERVLIHGAAGGVGLAAVQLAHQIGAVVVATEASEEKRSYLRTLGVEHIVDSSTPAFEAEVRRTTNGEGVDVVLNFLTGDFIPASLSTLREGGRFVEIGKRGIWSHEQVAEHRSDVAYHVLAVDRLTEEEPGRVGGLLRGLVGQFERGELEPPPVRCFELQDVSGAFRHLQQGRHRGKVVVEWDRRSDGELKQDGAYIVTGGLGGIGLSLAEMLVARGAQHLVLMDLRPPSGSAQERIDGLTREGTSVEVEVGDVANRADVARVVDKLARGQHPLRGVFHLAGVLDDGVLLEQDWQRFSRVFDPKAQGAWNLHSLTSEVPLDHFVVFSSLAALTGSSGQGNYAAANAYLDALAQHRRSSGLPALSINWGPWGKVGMAAALEEQEERRWAARGVELIDPDQGLAALSQLMSSGRAQVAVLRVDWARFLAGGGAEAALLSELVQADPAHQRDRPDDAHEVVRLLDQARSEDQEEVLTDYLQRLVARVLGLDEASPPDPASRLMDIGVDSLLAVELRNALRGAIGQTLPATLVFDYPTITAIARFLLDDVLSPGVADEAPSEASATDLDSMETLLDQLSDEDLEGLLGEDD